MTAEMIEKIQKVDRPPRYNHFRPNRSASRPANNSPLYISILPQWTAWWMYMDQWKMYMTEKEVQCGSGERGWNLDRYGSKKGKGGLTSHKPANKPIRPIEPTTLILEDSERYQGSWALQKPMKQSTWSEMVVIKGVLIRDDSLRESKSSTSPQQSRTFSSSTSPSPCPPDLTGSHHLDRPSHHLHE